MQHFKTLKQELLAEEQNLRVRWLFPSFRDGPAGDLHLITKRRDAFGSLLHYAIEAVIVPKWVGHFNRCSYNYVKNEDQRANELGKKLALEKVIGFFEVPGYSTNTCKPQYAVSVSDMIQDEILELEALNTLPGRLENPSVARHTYHDAQEVAGEIIALQDALEIVIQAETYTDGLLENYGDIPGIAKPDWFDHKAFKEWEQKLEFRPYKLPAKTQIYQVYTKVPHGSQPPELPYAERFDRKDKVLIGLTPGWTDEPIHQTVSVDTAATTDFYQADLVMDEAGEAVYNAVGPIKLNVKSVTK